MTLWIAAEKATQQLQLADVFYAQENTKASAPLNFHAAARQAERA
jgi:hypothetical protein